MNYNEQVQKKKIQIKEYLNFYSTSKKEPNYLDLLEKVNFIYCKVYPNSNPTDFVRLNTKVVTRKEYISKVVKSKDGYYYIHFTVNKYRVKSTFTYVKTIINELGLELTVE